MKIKISTALTALFWCLFAGIIIIGIGLGAAIPQLNFIAAPFVCPAGQMTSTSDHYSISPNSSTDVVTLYCVDATTGAQAELGVFPLVLYSGTIYGLAVFVVVMAILLLRPERKPARSQERAAPLPARAEDPKAKLEALKEMLSTGLITQEDFDQKKKEILGRM